MNNIPENWILIKLGEVTTKAQYGWTTKAAISGEIKYLRTTDLSKGQVDWDKVPYCATVPKEIEKYQLEEDDILISRAGSVGLSYRIQAPSIKTVFASYLIRFKAILVDPRYIEYFLKSPDYWKIVNEEASGSAMQNINASKLSNIVLPLSPLREQQRISKKLDLIFEKLDHNKVRLEKIPLILKNFRKIILKSAISGALTKKWREKNASSFSSELSKLPTNQLGWKTLTAQDACEKVSSGSTPINNPFTQTGDIPFLKVYNIQNQQIAFDYKPQFITSEIHKKKLTRSIVKPNDVLMNIVGPPLGKIALVTDQYPEWNINQAIVFFRPKKYLLPKYLYYVLCEGREIENISLELKGSAGQQNISLTQCRNFVFDIPSIEEQELIVSKIDALFDLAKSIEEKYDQVKAKIDKLPGSILEKAFKGELVEQDENDEPAEKLLERILGERKKILKAKKK